jgi:hypothetical protein
MSLHVGTGKGPAHLNRLPQGSGSVAPTTNANAQLVLNKTKKTGFTYFIRLL